MQNVFEDINELVISGTELANILDAFSESLRSSHIGTARPDYAIAGTQWIKVDNAADLSIGLWVLNVFDGNNDIEVLKVDPVNHTISFGGNNATAAFKIARTDALADLLQLSRSLNTAGGSGGFIYTQLNDADEVTTYGKAKFTSTSVADGNEAAKYTIELMSGGALTEFFSLLSTGLTISVYAGSGYRAFYATPTGKFEARPSEYAFETDYFAGEKIINNNRLYLVTSNFTSHDSDIANDLGNLRLIGNGEENPGFIKNATEDISDTDSIAFTASKNMQDCELTASGGNATVSSTPFGNTPGNFVDGMMISVVNLDAANDISINVNDNDYGYVGNGNLTLKRGYFVLFKYYSSAKRWLAISKNF